MTQLTTEQYWTVSSETGRFVGPFNQADLNRLVAEGRLTTKSPVFRSVTRKWVEVGCVLAPPDLPSFNASPPLVGPSDSWDSASRAPHSSLPLGSVAAFAAGAVLAGLLTAWGASRNEQADESIQESIADVQVSASEHIGWARGELDGHARGPGPDESPVRDSLDSLQSPLVDLSGIDRATSQERSRTTNRSSEVAGSSEGAGSSEATTQNRTERRESSSMAVLTESTNRHDRQTASLQDPAASLHSYRKWRDDSGRYSTTARLVGVNGSTVSLLKLDGTVIGVDRARLSEEDWFLTEAVEGQWEDQNAPDVLAAGAGPLEEDPETQLTSIATSRLRSEPPLHVGRTRTLDQVDRDRFAAYLDRRDERRVYATDRLRQINSMRGPHVYRTAVYAPVNPLGRSAIQAGWVYQPPILRSWYRPYRFAPSCSPRRVDSRYNYAYGWE